MMPTIRNPDFSSDLGDADQEVFDQYLKKWGGEKNSVQMDEKAMMKNSAATYLKLKSNNESDGPINILEDAFVRPKI